MRNWKKSDIWSLDLPWVANRDGHADLAVRQALQATPPNRRPGLRALWRKLSASGLYQGPVATLDPEDAECREVKSKMVVRRHRYNPAGPDEALCVFDF